MFKKPQVATLEEISTLVADIASLQRSRGRAMHIGNNKEWQILDSNIMSANQVLAFLLDERQGQHSDKVS